MSETPEIRYLNTDLDLVSPEPMEPLIAHLESKGVSPLMPTLGDNGNWYATCETDESYPEPDANIAAMLTAIESMHPEARRCWDVCTKRDFNVGYNCGDEPWAFTQSLSSESLRRMAACGATFTLTLYPFRDDSHPSVHVTNDA